ncbi:MAG: copper amine oxidase N-terminal domain-containing protein [Defluviitaleaceae bacterium]|nr:copper amine oxidase N-terminal domain-containing protein [Defluviitaleaceae bacterium]
MKKFILLCAVIACTFGIAAVTAYADTELDIYLNGERLEFQHPPRVIQRQVMVPGQELFEILDAVVEGFWWNGIFQIYPGDGSMIQMQLSNRNLLIRTPDAMLFGVPLVVAPSVIDWQVFVPLREIAEAFGATVEWDEQSTVMVTLPVETTHQEITVSTAEEFIRAIGSNRTIYVNPGVYDFTEWVTGPISPLSGFVGFHISGVRNLNIIGLGDVEFTIGEEWGFDLILEYADNVRIENITFPHTLENLGYMVRASSNITVSNVASSRISVRHSENILFDSVSSNNSIPRASPVSVEGSSAVFTNSNFSNNVINWFLFDIFNAYVRIENSVISGNVNNPYWGGLDFTDDHLFNVFGRSRVVITDTYMAGNVFRYGVAKSDTAVFEYEKGLFDGNYFEYFFTGEIVPALG